MQTELELQIREFIADNFFVCASPEELPDTASLLEAGIVDSTGVLELVAFLEQTFEISVADNEIVPENLDSVYAVANFVKTKRISEAA